MKKMNKVIAVAVAAAAMATITMTGCGFVARFSSTETETRNGVSKTVTTSTVNGRTGTETVYTDENGNILDTKTGEAAFKDAKAGETDTHSRGQNLQADEDLTDDIDEIEDDEDEIHQANLCIINKTGSDITELYGALEENEDWSDNWLKDGLVLEDGEECNTTVKFAADTAFKLGFVTETGEKAVFEDFTFSHAENSENITITFTDLGDAFNMNIKC